MEVRDMSHTADLDSLLRQVISIVKIVSCRVSRLAIAGRANIRTLAEVRFTVHLFIAPVARTTESPRHYGKTCPGFLTLAGFLTLMGTSALLRWMSLRLERFPAARTIILVPVESPGIFA